MHALRPRHARNPLRDETRDESKAACECGALHSCPQHNPLNYVLDGAAHYGSRSLA